MKIAVVIVTYNRLEKLKTTLRLFDEQTNCPDLIVVVNNASTDATPEFLSCWKLEYAEYNKHILTLPDNIGGSGGFYEGLRYALEQEIDWVWVSDDDAFPDRNAIYEAKRNISMLSDANVSALCGMVMNDGVIDCAHRRRIQTGLLRIYEEDVCEKEYVQSFFDIDLFSYVGTVLNVQKLKCVGLPIKDYFIYCDDAEHSLRLRQAGRILCVPAIVVYHNVSNDELLSWKTFYGMRNQLDMYRRHMPKRCYYYSIVKNIVSVAYNLIVRSNKVFAKMELMATFDAIRKKTGKNAVYKPGWKPQ